MAIKITNFNSQTRTWKNAEQNSVMRNIKIFATIKLIKVLHDIDKDEKMFWTWNLQNRLKTEKNKNKWHL